MNAEKLKAKIRAQEIALWSSVEDTGALDLKTIDYLTKLKCLSRAIEKAEKGLLSVNHHIDVKTGRKILWN